MNLAEAMRQVSEEYDQECLRAQNDPSFHQLMTECLGREYDELDQELPGYVHDVAVATGVPLGTVLPTWTYHLARLCFRLGMRTQRKLDRPDEPTSLFWRTDGKVV
jgi:hypothetical protein